MARVPFGIILDLFKMDLQTVINSAIHGVKDKVTNQGYIIETKGKFLGRRGCPITITFPKENAPLQTRDYFVEVLKGWKRVAHSTIKNAEQLVLTIYVKE